MEWRVYADEGMRVCTQCSAQLAYIEEGIEDDELDRWIHSLFYSPMCITTSLQTNRVR
jgi:hypothetical protein